MSPVKLVPMDFEVFLQKNDPELTLPKYLVCLDPGETTGYALFKKGILVSWGEFTTPTINSAVLVFTDMLRTFEPDNLVYEEYRVYAGKAQSHSWSKLYTPKLIGCIETLAIQHAVPTSTQMAQQPKAFCTDAKLKMWDYYPKGMKHARDAIRHGCYYLLFNHKKYH